MCSDNLSQRNCYSIFSNPSSMTSSCNESWKKSSQLTTKLLDTVFYFLSNSILITRHLGAYCAYNSSNAPWLWSQGLDLHNSNTFSTMRYSKKLLYHLDFTRNVSHLSFQSITALSPSFANCLSLSFRKCAIISRIFPDNARISWTSVVAELDLPLHIKSSSPQFILYWVRFLDVQETVSLALFKYISSNSKTLKTCDNVLAVFRCTNIF